jgi:5-oxoprolinase (ATP-hydrolysing) subunit C
MGLAVINPGLFSTVQDLGRTGYRAWGVPLGGSFDRTAAGLANALLGNAPEAAVIELTLHGGVYEALDPLALALAGAPMEAKIVRRDGRESPMSVPSCFSLDEGERLVLGGTPRGARTYLAVLGGWRTAPVLGSRSSETPLSAGEVIPCVPGWTPVRHPEADALTPAVDAPIRVIDGPDAGLLDPSWLEEDQAFRVGPGCDRMGVRLEGPAWEVAAEPERISTPIAPGAVQVAGGQPLVLGIACGTMGGYPHVAHVISADLDRIAQARPGDALRFGRVTLADARQLDQQARASQSRRISRIATAATDRIEGRGRGGSPLS